MHRRNDNGFIDLDIEEVTDFLSDLTSTCNQDDLMGIKGALDYLDYVTISDDVDYNIELDMVCVTMVSVMIEIGEKDGTDSPGRMLIRSYLHPPRQFFEKRDGYDLYEVFSHRLTEESLERLKMIRDMLSL